MSFSVSRKRSSRPFSLAAAMVWSPCAGLRMETPQPESPYAVPARTPPRGNPGRLGPLVVRDPSEGGAPGQGHGALAAQQLEGEQHLAIAGLDGAPDHPHEHLRPDAPD